MLYYLIAAALIGLDQGVKLWVRANLEPGQSIPFLPGVMDLTYLLNTGAAFSSFSGMTWLLALVSLGAVILLMVLLARNFFPGWWGKLSLSLLLAGAAGNLIDRVTLGGVTDMFETTFIHFAVFNVADICVVAGGVLMAAYVLLRWDKDREERHEAA